MIYDSSTKEIEQFDRNLEKSKPALREPAGFGESFMQELGLFWRENLSTSRTVALSNKQTDRARRIKEVAGDKAFIQAITTPGDPRTQAMIESLSAEHESVKSDAALMGEIRERNAGLRKERDAALENQTTGGKIGGFAGIMVGALSDPITLGTLPLGASWATGVLRTMAIEAGVSAAIETAIQPVVYRYKKELESPYDMKDALINIAGAGVGAGVLTGGVKATARAIGRFGRVAPEAIAAPRVEGFDDLLEAAERIPNATEEQRAAIEVLTQHADSVRQSPFVPHPELDDIHLGALAKATEDLESGRAVDVDDFIEQLEGQVRTRQIDAERARLARRDEMEKGFAALHSERGPEVEVVGSPSAKSAEDEIRELVIGHYFQPDVGLSAAEVVEYAGLVKRGVLTKAEADKLVEFFDTVETSEDSYTLRSMGPELLAEYKKEADTVAEGAIRTVLGADHVKIVKELPIREAARESQRLSSYIRNSGGVSIDRAGALRGEYEALFENGGKSGVVKRAAGLSPDELAQRAADAGYIDEPDPQLLKEALERDLAGDHVYSLKSDRFERKIELDIQRELDDYDKMLEAEFMDQEAGRITQGRKVKEMLDKEDMTIELDDGTRRSAREVIEELEGDSRAAAAIKTCMAE